MTFAIITDSASDIEPEFERKENIFIVPTIIIFDKEEFRDTEINRNEFLNRIKSGDIATTSQPSPADIDDKYREALKISESKEILGIHLTSRLSGTFSTVYSVVNNLETGTIKLFDSLSISIGSGYFVYLAAFLRNKGYSLDETLNILVKARNQIHVEIYIQGVPYLHRSGRISLGQYSLLRLLRLKPILNIVDGLLVQKGLVFGQSGGSKKLISRILKIDKGMNPFIMIGHATNPEFMDIFRKELAVLNPSQIAEVEICNTLISHTGLGPLGIGIAPSFESLIQ
ncbi:MAG: DegV domain-containing protein [Candidatus Heimdallarchaeota archaeon LC_2]|nr:MAG: DegV domain-containing protein [Candidatus Heimdallarchaeota archaeon LC_2]